VIRAFTLARKAILNHRGQAGGMTFKRPTLLSCAGRGARGDAQDAVSIPVRCAIGGSPAEETWITAIGRDRCTLRFATVGLTRAMPLMLHFASEAPVGGRLSWIGQGELGCVFDRALDEDLLDRLLALDLPANVVPLRRGPAR